jgi:hypothetical protein
MEAQMKERLKAKAELNRLQKEEQLKQDVSPPAPSANAISDEQLISIFSTGEKVEKTPRNAVKPNSQETKPKKKKGKK